MKDKSDLISSKRSYQTLGHSQRTSHSSLSHAESKSGVPGTSSKRNVAFDSKLDKDKNKKNTIQVLDDDGNDVTPRSLLSSDITSQLGRTSKTAIVFNENGSTGTPSDLFTQSMYGASTMQASYAAGFSRSIMSSMMGSSRASLDSVTDEISEPSNHHSYGGFQDVSRKHFDVKENLTPTDLKKKISITLEETDTIWHFDVPGVSVNEHSEEATAVKEANKRYDQLCDNRAGNDMYVQHGIQTFNDALKTKEIQTNSILTKEVGCMATNWDMFDTYNVQEVKTEDDNGEDELFGGEATTEGSGDNNLTVVDKTVNSKSIQSYMSESVRSFATESIVSIPSTEEGVTAEQSSSTVSDMTSQLNKLMKSESLLEHLFIMERVVVQNQYHARQAAYRGLEDVLISSIQSSSSKEDESGTTEETLHHHQQHQAQQQAQQQQQQETKEEIIPTKIGPNLSRLWSYECTATKALTVTCLAWNKQNPDLLAVGYGENGISQDGQGLACVWSIKNPEYPERVYTLKNAVTSIDFSLTHPNFLAVGLYNGTISVYNIRGSKDESVLDSIDSPGKHSGPIWQLKWTERDKGTGEEKGEVLISSSADGRVTQWSIRKGFEYIDLMKLKRVTKTSSAANNNNTANNKDGAAAAKKPDNTSSSKKNDALISRYASCMCFAFHNSDGNIYIAGTEEGYIHRCSCSYNEQFLETYAGHKGAVYKMMWSPYDSSFFLSCSADWTLKLWHIDKPDPVLSFQASTKAIVDMDWSPISSVMFAAVTEHQIEVWDLSVNTLDPLLVNLPITKVNLTSVKFSLNSEALLVGDCEGHVTIYQLREMNLNRSSLKNEGWLSKVINSAVSQNTEESSADGSVGR